MTQVSKLKHLIYSHTIIREWIENGEFDRAGRIIVIGTRFQAVMVKRLFKGTNKRIFYSERFEGKYTHDSKAGRTKWIVFDRGLRRNLPPDGCNILVMPEIIC